jgi:hypothetical protein
MLLAAVGPQAGLWPPPGGTGRRPPRHPDLESNLAEIRPELKELSSAADFFVSYTSTDRAWAEWIAWQLEAEGYQVVIQAWRSGGSSTPTTRAENVPCSCRYGSSR